MKNSVLLILVGSCMAFNSCKQAPSNEDQLTEVKVEFDASKEKQAIKKVIEQETKCFFERNYECWKEQWIHEDYALQIWNNSDGTFSAGVGWDKINEQGKEYTTHTLDGQKKITHPQVKRDNIIFKFYGNNVAYLIWKQYNSDEKKAYYLVSQETRLMEKVDGKWKIVHVSAFWDSVNKIPLNELKI